MRNKAQDVELLLAQLRDEVRQLREKVEAPLPRMLTYERAAHELSVSMSKLKQLVRAGALATCEVGKRKYIPLIEIERIERSATFSGKSARPPRSPAGKKPYNAAEEAAKARALTRQRR